MNALGINHFKETRHAMTKTKLCDVVGLLRLEEETLLEDLHLISRCPHFLKVLRDRLLELLLHACSFRLCTPMRTHRRPDFTLSSVPQR